MKIVCLTSNGYINCVEPFAYYWNRFAGTLRQVTVVGYDVAPQNLPDNFTFVSVGKQADYSWSAGLKAFLKHFDAKVILLMLEDYFLTSPADLATIEQRAAYMEYDGGMPKIDLSGDMLKYPHIPYDNGLPFTCSKSGDTPWKASLQAALWNTIYLDHILDPTETAWQFEKYGSKRMSAAGYYVDGFLNPPLTYANAVGGAGHKPGVIERKHMPDWMWDECVAKGWAR